MRNGGWVSAPPPRLVVTGVGARAEAGAESANALTRFAFQELGMGPKQQVPQWARDTINARYAKQRASMMAAAAHV